MRKTLDNFECGSIEREAVKEFDELGKKGYKQTYKAFMTPIPRHTL